MSFTAWIEDTINKTNRIEILSAALLVVGCGAQTTENPKKTEEAMIGDVFENTVLFSGPEFDRIEHDPVR